jgi:hypothetical protein
MLEFEETGVLDDYVKNLEKDPPSFEECDDRHICRSQSDFGPLRRGCGCLRISDFGLAAFGDKSPLHYHNIQPLQAFALEILLKAGWTYSVDICNMGMVVSALALIAPYSLQFNYCKQTVMGSLGAGFTT